MRFFDEAPITKPKTADSSAIPFTPDINNSIIDKLSDEQQAALEEVKQGHSIVVDSIIGAGKTTFIQAVCDSFPNSRILYLTYNRLLKLDAQKKIKNHNVTVQNYHGFVYKYLSRKGIRVEPSKQIRTFLERCSDVPLIYDLITIDEFQDSYPC